jgi:hypothetical protein
MPAIDRGLYRSDEQFGDFQFDSGDSQFGFGDAGKHSSHLGMGLGIGCH